MTYESQCTRQQTVAEIRARVCDVVGYWITDQAAVQASLACRVGDSELLSYLFNRNTCNACLGSAESLSIKDSEFATLFGHPAHQVYNNSCSSACDVAKLLVDKLGNAAQCTLTEPAPSASWATPHGKAAALYSMHTASHDTLLAMSLGGNNRSDSRRIEDVRADIEEFETDTVAIGALIVGLSECVTRKPS